MWHGVVLGAPLAPGSPTPCETVNTSDIYALSVDRAPA